MSPEDAFQALAERFMGFCDTFSSYFQLTTHNVTDKARRYINGLMVKAPRKNMERMEEYVEGYDYEGQQQFLSNSPWEHRPLVQRIGQEVDALVGGPDSVFIVDESGFEKKGTKSVGVARQWNGRLGKVDNCQVGVYAALSDGRRSSLVDMRLYLPKCWTDDPLRCEEAKVPEEECIERTKPQLAWEMINSALENRMRFGWIGLDGLYGNTPWLLRKIDDAGQRFLADVHVDQVIYIKDPKPLLPRRRKKIGPKFTKLRARTEGVEIGEFFEEVPKEQWAEIKVRESTKAAIKVRACRRRVWLWDGAEKQARQWWAVCVVDDATGEKKYFLSNADEKVSLAKLVRKHACRYWIERSFQDAKTSVGMADYQARGWTAWHHHMALVMLAMLFLLKERKLHEHSLDLLSCQDIVELLDIYLPRTDRTKEAVIENMRRRHRARRAAIESARRKSRKREAILT